MTTELHIDEVTFYRRDLDCRDVVWRDYSGRVCLPTPGGGNRAAALLIDVAVDGMFTIVYGQQVDRVILERVIEDLTYLVDQLDAVYPKTQSRGRCLAFGDWGRCYAMEGEPHNFPTEKDWERTRLALASARAGKGTA